MWLGDGCFFGICSVGGAHTYGFGNVSRARRHDPVEGRLDRLREQFADLGPAVMDYLACLHGDEQIRCSPIEWIEQEAWHTRRIVLVGDAAHASSPMMGQGGCQAMEDAWVLAEELRAAPTVEDALVSFDERRRARTDWVQRESRAVADGFALPAHVRDGVLRERGEEVLRRRFAPLVADP
jgi:2-polyprenyl-6-methoxyphenol hydroxylase-like FAD-dependent oxidoreductase